MFFFTHCVQLSFVPLLLIAFDFIVSLRFFQSNSADCWTIFFKTLLHLILNLFLFYHQLILVASGTNGESIFGGGNEWKYLDSHGIRTCATLSISREVRIKTCSTWSLDCIVTFQLFSMHYQCVLCNRCHGTVNVFLLLTLHSSTFALNSLNISGNKIQQPFAFNLIHFFLSCETKKMCHNNSSTIRFSSLSTFVERSIRKWMCISLMPFSRAIEASFILFYYPCCICIIDTQKP